MFRIGSTNIPGEKNISIALTYVYGIGPTRAVTIVNKLNISPHKKAANLTEDEIKAISEEIKHFPVEGELKRIEQEIISQETSLRTYRKPGQRSFRVIVIEAKKKRESGRYLEDLGFYNPHTKKVELDKANIQNILGFSVCEADMKEELKEKEKKINFRCLSCNQEYQTVSTLTSDAKVESCGNCVYPGASTSQARKGAVEKFRQRAQKSILKRGSQKRFTFRRGTNSLIQLFAITAKERTICCQPDESPFQTGTYGPYRQSQRLSIYQKYLQQLLAEKKAYYCFCSAAELAQEKEKYLRENQRSNYQYSRKCLNLTSEEIDFLLQKKQNYLIRFHTNQEKNYQLSDLVRGPIVFPGSDIEDFVLCRSNGVPLLNFAVVIDDHTMKISHILRGEEHLSNTAKQLVLYEALG
ncbi:395_t:CDS:2 [Gigaspora margarita]|uniref:395_t:CDS:1 n=1 Tax=Gigaspora margarita TaxID=4874 RepID=A0ABM8VWZ5_GIGMA|nr:395_t:CDS:2 [Gigaspora margarita]